MILTPQPQREDHNGVLTRIVPIEDVDRDLRELKHPFFRVETFQREISPTIPLAVDEHMHLARWWIIFSGEVNPVRISAFRKRLAVWSPTIDTRIEEVSEKGVRLRLVTEPSVTSHVMDRVVRELRDSVGIAGKISVGTQWALAGR
jgi:hypothetical protein